MRGLAGAASTRAHVPRISFPARLAADGSRLSLQPRAPPPHAAAPSGAPPAAAPAPAASAAAVAVSALKPSSTGEEYTDHPASSVRKIIASRLLESKRSPHLYVSREAPLDALLALKASLGFKASVNDLLVKAAALALQRVPAAGALQPGVAVDVAVAVATPGGLSTPVVRAADSLSLQELSQQIKALAGRAREGKLRPEEYSGGALSVTNLGMFPVSSFAAILNPPQALILAVGRAEPRVVMRAGQLATETVLTATLSVDQSRVSGAHAARFLQAFAEALAQPLQLV